MSINIERHKNILLKFCYVHATSAAHNRLLFFGAPVYSTNEASNAGSTRTIKQSIFLDVYDYESSNNTTN